ncbi:MAG: hypothetical protein JWO13_3564 [Acidobacteriales bacterium]|nr:hypothetical protein [Terriglobales bacterium]
MRLKTRHSAIAMVIALALAIAAGGAAAAQGHPGHGAGHGMMGDKLAKELNLTADQQAKLKQLMEADRAKMQALHQDQSLTKEQKMQQSQALRETMKNDMNSVLTPEQQQKFASLRESHGAGGPMGKDHDRLANQLNLTADQKTKMQSIMESNHQQMKAIHDDQSLSQQDKQAKVKQLHESMKSQVNAILTPDQQQKFAQMHQRMGKGHSGRGGFGGHQGEGAQTPPPGM